jgi:hypothetical protein
MGLVVIRLSAVGNCPRTSFVQRAADVSCCPAVLLSLSLYSKSHQDYLKIPCVWATTFFFGEDKKKSP